MAHNRYRSARAATSTRALVVAFGLVATLIGASVVIQHAQNPHGLADPEGVGARVMKKARDYNTFTLPVQTRSGAIEVLDCVAAQRPHCYNDNGIKYVMDSALISLTPAPR